jgi:hypothetical protein
MYVLSTRTKFDFGIKYWFVRAPLPSVLVAFFVFFLHKVYLFYLENFILYNLFSIVAFLHHVTPC